MPLDHFVSQVHLKNFYSDELGNLMHAIRKRDMHYFTPDASSVCRIENGSTNSYLKEERIIEDFLKDIEPFYNRAVDRIGNNEIDNDCIYVIAGFMSYVLTCSPAGMRINKNPFKAIIEQTAITLEKQGKLTQPPSELGSGSIKKLFENGKLNVEVDPKYSQAVGISDIISHLSFFANCHWEILINEHSDSPFFSSDFPVAIEYSKDPQIHNRIIPLRPNLAVRIMPHRSINTETLDYTFSGFRYRVKKLNRKEAQNVNRLLIRCAEELVFFCEMKDWIYPFVQKNSKYYIEPQVFNAPGPNGKYTFFTSRVVEENGVIMLPV